MTVKVDRVDNFKLNHHDKQERDANTFAICLLVPELALKHFIFNKKITNITTLAELFQVSEVLITERLKMLNLL